MSDERDKEIRRMMQHFEHQIAQINRETISQIVGDIHQNDFLNMARSIAVLRAQYLRDVLKVARAEDNALTRESCDEAMKARMAYQEAIESFDQLKHALKSGYFNLLPD